MRVKAGAVVLRGGSRLDGVGVVLEDGTRPVHGGSGGTEVVGRGRGVSGAEGRKDADFLPSGRDVGGEESGGRHEDGASWAKMGTRLTSWRWCMRHSDEHTGSLSRRGDIFSFSRPFPFPILTSPTIALTPIFSTAAVGRAQNRRLDSSLDRETSMTQKCHGIFSPTS